MKLITTSMVICEEKKYIPTVIRNKITEKLNITINNTIRIKKKELLREYRISFENKELKIENNQRSNKILIILFLKNSEKSNFL